VTDITERKRLEEEVVLREQRLNAFFKSASAGLALLDANMRYVQINTTLAEMNGIPPEEHIGKSVAEVIPKIAPVLEPLLRKVLASGEAVLNLELQGETPSQQGVVRHWMESLFPVQGKDGTVEGVGAITVEITDRKRIEEGLMESERRFREMLENVDLIAMTLDRNGVITFCNERLLRTTGWERADLMGANWFTRVVPGNEELHKVFFEGLATDRMPAHHENAIRTRDGELREIAWSNTMLRDSAGNVVGTASIGEDVTDRKRAAERIREQADMLDRAHDAIIVRGFADERITFWSKGAETAYGWTVEEAIGRELGALIAIDPETLAESRTKLLANEEWRGETRHKAKDGRELLMLTRASLVRNAAGEPVSVLSINSDITAEKQMEAQFLRAQRMESIGTLASGVAHDLNNILSPIMMSVPLLRCDLSEAERMEIIDTIEVSADRGAQIVKQVLTFGRGLQGERHPLPISDVVRELMRIIHDTIPKDIEILQTLEPNLLPVLGDVTQLIQVLLNLCVNARDAMPTGGKLRLRVANADIDASYASMIADANPGIYLLIEVSDTGSGIPPEIVERIFDPFFTTKEIGKGTGLGLSTVLGIVKSHGGFLNVLTQAGRGTTFQVYLPALLETETAAAEPAREALPMGNGELILVADDEPTIREAARRVLETAGYRAVLAADGTEALVAYVKNADRVALVLTDLMMPSMDGRALIRALRSLAPKLPIVASTGLGEDMQKSGLSECNVELVLQKPYHSDSLLRTIHQALRQK
jgi:PAS domain S-box-containing protein